MTAGNIGTVISWLFSQATASFAIVTGNWFLAILLGLIIVSALITLIVSLFKGTARRRRY